MIRRLDYFVFAEEFVQRCLYFWSPRNESEVEIYHSREEKNSLSVPAEENGFKFIL